MNLNKVYSCVICGDEFESRQAVNEHLEDEHGCENDDFALNTKLSLKLIKTSKTEDSEDEDVTIVGDGQAPVIKAVSHSLYLKTPLSGLSGTRSKNYFCFCLFRF